MRKREARKKKKKEKNRKLNCSLEMKFLRASLDLWRNSPPPPLLLLLLLQRTTRRKHISFGECPSSPNPTPDWRRRVWNGEFLKPLFSHPALLWNRRFPSTPGRNRSARAPPSAQRTGGSLTKEPHVAQICGKIWIRTGGSLPQQTCVAQIYGKIRIWIRLLAGYACCHIQNPFFPQYLEL